MSGAMENRAAVFTSSSQDVEVYRAGVWESGSMLGWRHEPDGSCRAWVRLGVGGDDTTWIDLADVRLPEPPGLRGVEGTRVTTASAGGVTGGSSGRRGPTGAAASELTPTLNLSAVRDQGGGTPSDRAVPPRAAAPGPGGRRRAPEPAEVDGSAAYWAALDAAGRAAGAPSAPGRHRAPAAGGAGAGRHRAADTEVMPAVGAGDRARAVEEPRSVAGPARAAAHDEPDLYTRPMRLATVVPQQRAAGWDLLGER